MRVKILRGLATALAAVGAINCGLAGLFRLNPVAGLLGRFQGAERIGYLAMALAGVWLGASRLLPRVRLALGVRSEGPMEALKASSLVGKLMPSIGGTTLGGGEVAIPADTQGKVGFLAMGFSYDSRFQVEDWLRAFQERFGDDPVAVSYEMAMIDAPLRLFGAAISEGMRLGTPADAHDQVVTVYATQTPLRQALRAASTSDSWVYLLDPEGRVLFQCGGPFDSERFQELDWVTESALARAKAPTPDTVLNW